MKLYYGLYIFFLTDKYLVFLGMNIQTKADFFPCTWFIFTLTSSSLPCFSLICFLTNTHQVLSFVIARWASTGKEFWHSQLFVLAQTLHQESEYFPILFSFLREQSKKGLLDFPTGGSTSIYTEKRKFSFRNLTCMG